MGDAWHYHSTCMGGEEDKRLLSSLCNTSSLEVKSILKEGTKYKHVTIRSKTSVLASKDTSLNTYSLYIYTSPTPADS